MHNTEEKSLYLQDDVLLNISSQSPHQLIYTKLLLFLSLLQVMRQNLSLWTAVLKLNFTSEATEFDTENQNFS